MGRVRFHHKIGKKYSYEKIVWAETHDGCSGCEDYYPAADYEALDAKLAATESELETYRNSNKDFAQRVQVAEAKLAETEKERDQAIELMSMRYENLNRDGKTILDFQSVWISQARSRIEKLEAKLEKERYLSKFLGELLHAIYGNKWETLTIFDAKKFKKKINYEGALADARLQAYEIACEEHKKEVRRLCERAESCEAKLAALVEIAETAEVLLRDQLYHRIADKLKAAIEAAKGGSNG